SAYRKLGGGMVAVRSSATAEDVPEASFAGQQSTYLNIEGEDEVVKAVQRCWASLFEPRAIFYRHENRFEHLKVHIAVPVQKMVQSEASGVMFTVDPLTNDTGKIVIEAVWGLGEAIVSGEITPDLYTLDKASLTIAGKCIARQESKYVRNHHGKAGEANVWVPVAPDLQDSFKLSDTELLALAEIGRRIEKHYQVPQDIEWAKEGGKLYIVQSRPVTTLKETKEVAEVQGKVLLTGSPASPGMGAGLVSIVRSAADIGKVKEGDILVAEMTTPDFVPAMKRANAMVTDRGGRTCHAAIVSRELGIPCVVGARHATTTLKAGQEITVDGSRGVVYEGKLVTGKAQKPTYLRGSTVKTRTKLYVNLAEPELAPQVAARNVDGVGLLRAEFIIAQIGQHPNYLLKQGRGSEFTEKLAAGLTIFAKAFNPRPVVYRTSDFKTNEYRNLEGGAEFEEMEENPMLGYRGASRYIKDFPAFKLELDAIKQVRQQYKNLHVMIPFVRTVAELAGVKKLLEDNGLRRSPEFKLWMMVEVPSNIILLDKFLDVGLDGISIGSNDLTQLTLGIDRDSPKLAEQFDERNEAVMLSLEKAIKTAVGRGVTASICGQAPSSYPDLTEKLVHWGITSVSVSPDAIERTREIIDDVEKKQA
ncbi:MAG: phosphoenolpyruvate synthase, partial [Dehalococcoidia bacterium]|nr:phosphoenolpyruvate synthase [Dehalococcoidia bacterium]